MMSTEKNKLFNIIKQKLPKNVLFTEEIADVLDVSYDASYRRIKGKTSLAFEEALKLAKHYKISNNIDGLIELYKEMSSYTKSFNLNQDTNVIYTARDIPFYHVKTDTLYWKFRVYAHVYFLQKNFSEKHISFYDFKPKFLALKEARDFRNTFKQTNITDIWGDSTINNSLHQIFYFYKTNMLQKEDALILCDEIKNIVKEIEESSKVNSLTTDGKKGSFQLFHSKLLNLNHTIFFKNKNKKGVLITYGSFSHIKIEDQGICNEIDVYIRKQLQLAKKISSDSEIERKVFFTVMYEKIEQLHWYFL
jgi:predicted DNA-binding protein YlxM (UPF0122 family)